MQQWTKCKIHQWPSFKVQAINNHYSVCHQEIQYLQLVLGSSPRGEGPAHGWQVDNTDRLSVASKEVGYDTA